MVNSHDLYDKILNNAPSQETLHLILRKLREEGEIEKVIQECLKALEVYPNDVHIRRLLAECYFETDRVFDAEAELKKITHVISDLAQVHKLQAMIYRKQGRNEEAIEALKVYSVYHPLDEEARLLHDELKPEDAAPPVSETQGFPEATSTAFGEELEKGAPEIITSRLAELYLDQGKVEKAIDTYKTLVMLNPGDARFRKRLEELKAMTEEEATVHQEAPADPLVARKQRMLAILETWRAIIRDQVSPN
jgi:tetratricopeptide (TPR) repeat protein